MSEHLIDLPRKIVIGYNIIDNIKNYLNFINIKNPIVIVTGPNVHKSVTYKVENNLAEYKMEIKEVKSATINEVYEIEDVIKREKASIVIGVGGGKVIDVSKYAAYKAGIEFVSVPTAPSHDGITSPFASIKGLGKPVSVKAKGPLVIIADIEVLSSAPRRLINAGIGDTVAKLIAVRDWKLAMKLRGEYYGEYTASLALLSAKYALNVINIINNKNYKEAVRTLMEALISSGVAMGMAGSTRPASGSEHLFAHAVELLTPTEALHGELVALGTIMMAYVHGINWKKIRNSFKRVGLPVKAKELGISDEVVIKALTIAHTIRPERYTILGDKGLTWSSAEKIARETEVID